MDPLVLHTDRQGNVDTALGPPAAAVGPGHLRAHLWTRCFAAFDQGDVVVHKLKAHATEADVAAGKTSEWASRGNACADWFARLGPAQHGVGEAHLAEVAALSGLAMEAGRGRLRHL
jgi:hypothetical protein